MPHLSGKSDLHPQKFREVCHCKVAMYQFGKNRILSLPHYFSGAKNLLNLQREREREFELSEEMGTI